MEQPNMATKAALVNVTNSQGWQVILTLGEQLVTAAERAAIDCEEESRIVGLTREAKGARRFFDNLINSIDNLKNPETQNQEFMEVSY